MKLPSPDRIVLSVLERSLSKILLLSLAVGLLAQTANAQAPDAGNRPAAAVKSAVRGAQQCLQALGYEPGSTDGVLGSKTMAAVRRFQSDKGLPVTGTLDGNTLGALGCKAGPQPATSVEAPQPGLVSSVDLLVENVPEAEFKGTVSVTPTALDCRRLTFLVDATYKSPQGLSGQFAVFYPGLIFRIVGHSCLPTKTARFNARYDVQTKPGPGAGMGLVDGRLVSSGPMIVNGTVSMALSDDAGVIDFNAGSDGPFVFNLTKNGFEYVSGTGTVKLPNGKAYTFPER